MGGPIPWLLEDGRLPALPVQPRMQGRALDGASSRRWSWGHPAQITQEFGWGELTTPFRTRA